MILIKVLIVYIKELKGHKDKIKERNKEVKRNKGNKGNKENKNKNKINKINRSVDDFQSFDKNRTSMIYIAIISIISPQNHISIKP
ncbi:MAG: hypothetical protein ACTSU2_17065 [Promethearchaeota archaeon]